MHTGLSDGIDVKKNFQRILESLSVDHIDLIVLTGDLVSRDAIYEEVYVIIKQRLDAAGVPFRIIPGNHDHVPSLCRIFGTTTKPSGELYWVEKQEDITLIFIDSSTAGCSNSQFNWFENTLKKAEAETIVFMHHPPCLMGVPFMDREWLFTMSDGFLKRIRSVGKQVTVFCGHYHTDTYLKTGTLQIFTCPAVSLQYDPTTSEHTIESRRFGWRHINISQGKLSSSVRYLEC